MGRIHDTKYGLHMHIYLLIFPHGVEKEKVRLTKREKIDWYHKFDNIFFLIFPLPHQGLCNYSHVAKRIITTHVLKG